MNVPDHKKYPRHAWPHAYLLFSIRLVILLSCITRYLLSAARQGEVERKGARWANAPLECQPPPQPEKGGEGGGAPAQEWGRQNRGEEVLL